MGVPRGQAQGRHVVNRNSLSKRPLAAHLSQCAALTWKSGLWQHSPLLGACSTGSFAPRADIRSERRIRQLLEISAPKSSWTPVMPQHTLKASTK